MCDSLIRVIQEWLGDDDEGNPITYEVPARVDLIGYDDEGSPIFVEMP